MSTISSIKHAPSRCTTITTRRLDADQIANVLAYLEHHRVTEGDFADEVAEAIRCGKAEIFSWLQEHLRSVPLISP